MTPAFAGLLSGHSTFSRAAAEVLTAITGSPYFPGGLTEWTVPAAICSTRRGRREDVTLQWATYFDAADQAGMSRIYMGIHIAEDDFDGRTSAPMRPGRLGARPALLRRHRPALDTCRPDVAPWHKRLNPRGTNSVTVRDAGHRGQRSETFRRANLGALVRVLHAEGPLRARSSASAPG